MSGLPCLYAFVALDRGQAGPVRARIVGRIQGLRRPQAIPLVFGRTGRSNPAHTGQDGRGAQTGPGPVDFRSAVRRGPLTHPSEYGKYWMWVCTLHIIKKRRVRKLTWERVAQYTTEVGAYRSPTKNG